MLLLNAVRAFELRATTSGRTLTPSFDKIDLFFINMKMGEHSIPRYGNSISIFRFTFQVRKASKHIHTVYQFHAK